MNFKPRIDPRVARTRQLLKQSLFSLMKVMPYSNITVNDITQQATVNRSTFYDHFMDKQDLLDSSVQEVISELRELLAERMKLGGEIIRNPYNEPPITIEMVFNHFQKHQDFYRVMLSDKGISGFHLQIQETFACMISRGIDLALGDPTRLIMPKEILLRYASSALVGILELWLDQADPLPPAEISRYYLRIAFEGFLGSVRNDIGLKELPKYQ